MDGKRTSKNSPLCSTGHWPFGAAALLSLHLFTGSLPAGNRVLLTMCDPWKTSCVCLTIEEGRVGVRNPHWGWGLDTPAHLFAILLWPLVTCPTLCKSEEKAWQSEIVLTPEKMISSLISKITVAPFLKETGQNSWASESFFMLFRIRPVNNVFS